MPEKILIVHNYYKIAGGEDVVVANEKKLLEEHGHEVVLYTRDNKELDEMGVLRKAGLFFTTIYNLRTYKDICNLVKTEHIDVIHVHNTLNLISPAVYYAARKCKVPVVNTIHNFRMLCPKATLYRNGRICEDCIEKGLKCALIGRCYRDSLSQTFVCVLMTTIHRLTGIYRYVNYICLTDFNKDKLLELNKGRDGKIIKSGNVYVKPNFMELQNATVMSAKDREDYILFAGRLDESKGIDLLLEAIRKSNVNLVIAGSGPLEDEVINAAGECDNISYVGMLDHAKVVEYMRKAKAVVLPTRWYEGFPMSIAESFSVGTPVIGPAMGNVGNIIRDKINGYVFKNGDVNSLLDVINHFNDAAYSEEIAAMYDGAYKDFCDKYTDEINYDVLIKIYRDIQKQN